MNLMQCVRNERLRASYFDGNKKLLVGCLNGVLFNPTTIEMKQVIKQADLGLRP